MGDMIADPRDRIAAAMAKKQGILPLLEANPDGYGGGPSQTELYAPSGPEMRSRDVSQGEEMADRFSQDIGPSTRVAHRLHDTVQAIGDYGGIPGRIAFGVATQPIHAIGTILRAADDPTLPKVTNAGVQTALSFPGLKGSLAAAGILTGGYGASIAKDLGAQDLAGTPANAVQPKKQPAASSIPDLPSLLPEENAAYKAARQKLEAGDFANNAERRALENTVTQFTNSSSSRGDAAFGAKTKNASDDAELKRTTDKALFDRAQDASKREMLRDRRYSDTSVAAMDRETGGYGPMIASALAGTVFKPSSTWSDFGRQWAAGSTLAASGNVVPTLYDAKRTESVNPKFAAKQAEALTYPDGDPRRTAALKDLDLIDKVNPVQKAAEDHLTSLPWWGTSLGVSALEGLEAPLGAKVISALSKTPEAIGSLVGKFKAGQFNGQANASIAHARAVQADNKVEKLNAINRALSTENGAAAEQQSAAAEQQSAVSEQQARKRLTPGPSSAPTDDHVAVVVKGLDDGSIAFPQRQPRLAAPAENSSSNPQILPPQTISGEGGNQIHTFTLDQPTKDLIQNVLDRIAPPKPTERLVHIDTPRGPAEGPTSAPRGAGTVYTDAHSDAVRQAIDDHFANNSNATLKRGTQQARGGFTGKMAVQAQSDKRLIPVKESYMNTRMKDLVEAIGEQPTADARAKQWKRDMGRKAIGLTGATAVGGASLDADDDPMGTRASIARALTSAGR